jgi:hypothetical protein
MPSNGDTARTAFMGGLSRYRYLLAVAVAALLVLVLLPDGSDDRAKRSSREAASPATLGTGPGAGPGEVPPGAPGTPEAPGAPG